MKKLILLLILAITGFGVNAQCSIEVDLSSNGSWGDEITWTLIEDATFTVVLSGGPYGAPGWTDNQSVVGTPPFTFNITSVGGAFCDNSALYTVSVGGTVSVSGTHVPCAAEVFPVVTACAACSPPFALNATGITATSATLGWSASAGAVSYDWEVQPLGVAQGTATTLPSGTGLAVLSVATGALLSSNTSYTFYVRANCGAPSTYASADFITGCTTFVAPFSENFDVALTTPNCWTNTPGGEPWSFAVSGSPGPGYGVANAVDHTTGIGNFAWIDASGAIGVNELISPMIDMSALTTPQVGYWIFSNNTNDLAQNTIELYAWDGAAWVLLNTYGGNFAGWLEVIVPVPGAIPTTTQFRLVQVESTTGSGSAWFNDLLVDDFFVNETPLCPAPAALSLSAVVTLPSTADLSWTSSGVGNTYTVEYRVVGAGAWTAAPGNPYAGTTAQLLGLSTDDFEWQVASECAGPLTSAFSGGTFTTVPFPGTCATAQAIGPGTFIAPGPSMGGGAANLCAGAATNANWYAYTATVTGTAAVESTSGGDTYVEVSDAACGALVCYASNDDGGLGALSLVTFDICAGSTYYIEWTDRWGAIAAIGFDVTETAVCADPSTAAVTSTLDGFDATTTWTAGGGSCGGGYEWALVADAGIPLYGAGDIAFGTGAYPVSLAAVTGLSDGTPYDLYVRDICGATFSLDVLTNFTTVAACAAPGGLAAVVTLPSTADLSWTTSGVGNTYTVEYRVVGAGAWTAAPGNPYAGTTAQLLGLSTDEFEWQVASNCVGPVTSAFATGTPFTTVPFPGTCATAQAIGPGTFIAPGASMGGGAINPCGGFGSNANWYAYTATVTGTATVSSDFASNTGNDTWIQILTGACGAQTCYAFDDDAGSVFLSIVTFDVCAGSTYYIEWTDRYASGANPTEFSVTETSACADPSTATITPTSDGFDGASTWTAGGGSCGGGYEWALVADAGIPLYGVGDIAFGTGAYPVSLAAVTGLSSGTPYDLYVRDVCGATFSLDVLTNFTTLAACPPPGGLTAVVTLPSTADLSWTTSGFGNTYTVEYRVVGAGAWTAAPGNPYAGTTAQLLGLSTDDFEWQVASNCAGPVTSAFGAGTDFTTIPFPGTCATADPIGPGTFIAPGPSMGGGAANLCAGFASNANWYAYTAVLSGTATVESTSGGDTYVEVSDAACGALVCYASNDDGGVGALSLVTFTICAGSTYYIEWTDRWGATAPIGFDVTETAACADPGTASGIITLDGLDASTSWPAGSGACGGGFEWEVVADGAAAFSGNDLASGTGSYPVSIPAVTGLMSSTPYDLYVRDVCGATFSLDILTNFTTLAPPPANNDCADAIEVYGGYAITGFSTVGATGTDITSCTFNDVASVWFEYTPACNTTVEVNSCGSTYDTNLSIWDACSGGTELACNDDASAGACAFSLQSFVSFAALANTTYYIRIAGYNGSTGLINFAVNEVTVCPCTQNVWTGASLIDNTDWSDAANWTCSTAPTNNCLTPLGSDTAIIPAGTVLAPVITGTQGAVSLEVGVGSSITIDGTLQICGNVSHNGNSLTGAGDLELNGTATQMLSGNGAFGMVELNNAAGASVMASASLSVDSALILTAGTFTNNGAFSLNSAFGGTAFLDDFTPTSLGTYSGDLTVNRYVTDGFAGGLGQRYFGSAVSGSAASGLDNTYTVYPVNGFILPLASCDPDTINPFSPYSNLLEWREDATFPTSCVQEGWWALPTSSTNLMQGRGYSGWMTNGSTVSVTGAPNTGGQSFGVTNSVSNTTVSQGWHVLSNPYPSPMNVDAVTLGSGLSSPQYYNSASGAWSGTFQPVLIAGAEIPVMQGFTAFSVGAGTYTPSDAYRVDATNANFAKSTSWFDYRLDIEVNVGGNGDITYLYYSPTSTDQFDIAGDCVKRQSNSNKPTLYTRNNGDQLSLNGLNLNDLGMSVPMGLIAPEVSSAEFTFSGMDDFPANTIIYLEDKLLGVFHKMEDGPYSFNADPAQNGTDRFEIHFSLAASFNLIEPTCENDNAVIVENSTDGRTFTISNAGVLEQTGVLDGSENILSYGDYEVEVFDVFGTSQIYVFVVEEVVSVDATVLASATDIEIGETIDFDYSGSGASNFEWYIDGQLMAQTELFNFQFNLPGEYLVELNASNDICAADAEQTILVSEKTTSILAIGDKGSLSIYADNEANIVLDFTNVNEGTVNAGVYNLLGQELASVDVNSNGKQMIRNVQWAQGYYIVKVQIGDQVVNQTVLINK